MSETYQSSVLRCNDHSADDPGDGCPVCEFLNGSLKTGVLLRVIEVLDSTLAATEASERRLIARLQERRD